MNKYRTEEIHKIVVLCLDLVVFSISRKCHFSLSWKWDKYTCWVLFQWFLSHYSHSTQFIHLHVLLIQICCNSWGKNMFWMFRIVKKYSKKNHNTNILLFVSCGLFLTTACNREQRSRWNWVKQSSRVLRLPLMEKKAALRYSGKKSHFRPLFPDLEVLCPKIMFILLL